MGKLFKNLMVWMDDYLVSIYLIIVLVGLPLYTHDMLYDIASAKFYFLACTTVLSLILWLLIKNRRLKTVITTGWKRIDILYVVFIICAILSTLACDYPRKAFTGEAGRDLGLVTCLLFACACIMVSTAKKISNAIWFIWGVSSIIVGLLGILNHYGIDPLGFFAEMYDEQIPFFMSTMGNIDFFSGYMAFVFTFFASLIIVTDKLWNRVFYSIVTGITAFSIICCRADAGYIMVIMFILCGWILADDRNAISRFLFICGLFCSVVTLTGILDSKIEKTRELDGIGLYLTSSKFVFWIAIAFFMVSFVFKINKHVNVKKLKAGAYVVLGIFIFTMIVLFFMVNFTGLKIADTEILYKFKITDDFGATRGYVWRKTVEYFKKLPIENKLFGIGPDLAIFVYDKILYVNPTVELPATFDNAHNEFLQLMLTHGLAGTIAYYSWIIGSSITMLKNREKCKLRGICGFTIIGFIIMMQVCVNVVYLTFIPFLVLCVGKNGYIEDLFYEK